MEKLLDTWQEVKKGLFVVDPDVECKRFLDRMVQMAGRNNAEFTLVHCLEEPSRQSVVSPAPSA